MNKLVYLSISLLVSFHTVQGQGDTLAEMRRFMTVCNSYKQLPVQVNVVIDRYASMATHTGDSSRMEAFFSLRPEGAYMRMEGVEQLVNDSLMLVVNTTTRRMVLYTHHQSVKGRLQDYLGMQLADSTVTFLAGKYRCFSFKGPGDTSVIEMRSRVLLAQTTFPREEVKLSFDAKTDQPFAVRQLKRSLVMVSKEVYHSVAGLPEWEGKALSTRDSLFFLVKEQVMVFHFQQISHDPGGNLPVRVSDRIAAELPGRYRPVTGYAGYVLNQQF